MPYKFLRLLVIGCWLLVVGTTSVYADTPTPAPLPTCDLCGWCNQEVNPKPPNWDECQACLSKPQSYYTVLGCFSTDPSGAPFVKSILSIIFGIAGGTAFLAVLYGASVILTSSGSPERLQAGKDIIMSSLFGLLLIVFSVFLLRVIGVEIIRLPGFG